MPASAAASTPETIDVRSLIPMQRHQRIFELVDQLVPGKGFVLINDHDPKRSITSSRPSIPDSSPGPIWRAVLRSGGSRSRGCQERPELATATRHAHVWTLCPAEPSAALRAPTPRTGRDSSMPLLHNTEVDQ